MLAAPVHTAAETMIPAVRIDHGIVPCPGCGYRGVMASTGFMHRLAASVGPARAWLDSPRGILLQKAFSITLSVIVLVLLARSIALLGWREVLAALPASPLFWLCFIGAYVLPPLGDWAIYRRWWPIGWRSLAVFLKMRVMNEALFSYSGHTYLMVWSSKLFGQPFDPSKPAPRILGRGNTAGLDPSSAPLAAIKDMAITSGLAGNFTTLVLLVVALAMGGGPIIAAAMDPRTVSIFLWAFSGMILLNIGIVLFRNQVMSIPARENVFAFLLHLLRVNAQHILFVASWVIALPMIDFGTWFLLGALRMVIMRMPIPNKELLFAAIAVQLTGEASVAVAALMAAQGALHLVFHGLAWGAAAVLEASGPLEDDNRRRTA